MSGLADSYLKLNWAKRHLEELDVELEAYHNSDPCQFSTKDETETQQYFLRIDLKTIPDALALRCGDAFYCMRASLDQLVWRLAKLTVDLPRQTQFPIIERWTADTRKRFDSWLTDVPADAISVIQELQPANSPAPPEAHILWKLHAMCNLDKHRRIPANGAQIQFHYPPGTDPIFVHSRSFKDGLELSVPLAEKSKLQLPPSVTFQVVFGDIQSKVVLGPLDIRSIYDFISDSVLPRFVRFFS
jgi:hypothetical protein